MCLSLSGLCKKYVCHTFVYFDDVFLTWRLFAGTVIDPYLRYKQLMPAVLDTLRADQSWAVRREVWRYGCVYFGVYKLLEVMFRAGVWILGGFWAVICEVLG